MKHMYTPMALLNFCLHIQLHVTSTTLNLGYLGKTFIVSLEIATFLCHGCDPIIMKHLSEQLSETLSEKESSSVYEKQ